MSSSALQAPRNIIVVISSSSCLLTSSDILLHSTDDTKPDEMTESLDRPHEQIFAEFHCRDAISMEYGGAPQNLDRSDEQAAHALAMALWSSPKRLARARGAEPGIGYKPDNPDKNYFTLKIVWVDDISTSIEMLQSFPQAQYMSMLSGASRHAYTIVHDSDGTIKHKEVWVFDLRIWKPRYHNEFIKHWMITALANASQIQTRDLIRYKKPEGSYLDNRPKSEYTGDLPRSTDDEVFDQNLQLVGVSTYRLRRYEVRHSQDIFGEYSTWFLTKDK
ncbi:hypothetical protein FRC09_002642 [Ceratobasidium sp. 395]|nr:hypothetical protein FRC09_002642 [Ceratobasidium sp. 395]